eukprot:TRINITY_DN11989_c0_g1_i12.p1 TRINITY_DN11989_c0_g1~~TRINITY_DN11989_c0_g1_i12.p1  ORF type:complete len:194 (-),score=9.72 TRINITY_DN11989_c0_g1_i12:200-781(-)
MLLDLHEREKVTWVTHIKSLLCQNGFGHVWLFGCGQEKWFLRQFRTRLRDCFCQKWNGHLLESDRLSLYSSFKSCLEREKYLDVLFCNMYKSALARFRCGVSFINSHRHYYSGGANRTCPFCPDCLENERHFLFLCPLYSSLRQKYLPHIERTQFPLVEKAMNPQRDEHIIALSKYIVFALEVRKKHIFQITT